MKKNKISFIALTILSLLFLTAIASAYSPSYYNYGNDGYERTSYVKTTVKDSPYGQSYSKTTAYDKESNTIYLGYGGYAKTTSYTKTETKSPDFQYSRPSPSYLGNRYYYGSYYPKSSYNYDYDPYLKYDYDYSSWRYRPSYTYETHGSGDRYGWDYYYEPVYIGHYNWRY